MPQDNKNTQEKPQEKPSESVMDKMLGGFDKVIEFARTTWYRMHHVEQTNMELGLKHMNAGNYFDAALRFKYACWKNKNNFIAHYMQGKAYTYAGKFEKAVEPLRKALADNPELEEARFLLACCGENIKIDRVPPSLIIENLELIADTYDDQVAQTRNYSVNLALKEELDKIFDDKQGFEALDINCRTGDAADAIMDRANHIVGVDPSLKMISKARDKRKNDRLVYNQLVGKLALDFLKTNDKKFDIITNTFSFFNYGDLNEHFDLISKTLNKDGIFAFNIVASNSGTYVFNAKSITFLHSPAYIKELAEEHGMEIVSNRVIEYQNSSSEILFMLKKK